MRPRRVRPPIIEQCVAHVECRVTQVMPAGDKALFVGLVVDAYADWDVERGVRRIEYGFGEFPQRVYGTRFGPGGASD